MGVGEDGRVGVPGNVIVDRSESGMLDGGWNFSWDDCRVTVGEDAEFGEVMSLVGFDRWHMVRSCIEWWEKILAKGWWFS